MLGVIGIIDPDLQHLESMQGSLVSQFGLPDLWSIICSTRRIGESCVLSCGVGREGSEPYSSGSHNPR